MPELQITVGGCLGRVGPDIALIGLGKVAQLLVAMAELDPYLGPPGIAGEGDFVKPRRRRPIAAALRRIGLRHNRPSPSGAAPPHSDVDHLVHPSPVRRPDDIFLRPRTPTARASRRYGDERPVAAGPLSLPR